MAELDEGFPVAADLDGVAVEDVQEDTSVAAIVVT